MREDTFASAGLIACSVCDEATDSVGEPLDWQPHYAVAVAEVLLSGVSHDTFYLCEECLEDTDGAVVLRRLTLDTEPN